MSNLLYHKLIDLLTDEPFYSDFKFRKRDKSFIKKTEFGFEALSLENYWIGYDLKRDKEALVIQPLYLKRFDILHKWFEKFSFKTLSDQRDNYSIGFDGKMLGETDFFYFLLNEEDFENDFNKFKLELIQNCKNVFIKFSSMKNLYQYLIEPILDKKVKLPNGGADWAFEYLTLCKLVNPEKYNELKELITKQVQIMNERNEPNVKEYYPKLKEILYELESVQLN